MSDDTVIGYEPPIIGVEGNSSGNDLIRVEASITFDWVPDPGMSYRYTSSSFDDLTGDRVTTSRSAPSRAAGAMTFDGVSSSAPFRAGLSEFGFRFTDFASASLSDINQESFWHWNPATGAMGGLSAGEPFNDYWVSFDAVAARYGYDKYGVSGGAVDRGHWALTPDPHDVDVFGGAGNDTIYGGQGNELLSGGDGNDVLWAGLGADTVLGGDGGDLIHGGTGAQLLDGGIGSDTICAGSGSQIVMGGDGRDLVQGGAGMQTVLGGAGRDTINGGVDAQLLMGEGGDDYIRAGNGNQTLVGGAGHDVFAFGEGVHGQIVVGDFTPGQDRIEVARGPGRLLMTVDDLAAHVSSDAWGAALLDLGAGTTVTLTDVSAHQVKAHLQTWFRVV